MELELRQQTVRCWETVCRTAWEQEETAETIVPDACPDIWQVLDGSGTLLIQRKEPQEGRAELAGLLRVNVLYQPEGEESGIRAMEVTVPFSASPELAGCTRRAVLRAEPRVLSVDVHLLNPRKILVRVAWQLGLEVLVPQALVLPSGAADTESYAIQQRTGRYVSVPTVAVVEKRFAYSDALALPSGRPDVAELLRTRVGASCGDARIVGSKLMCKGEAVLWLLCRGEDGTVFPVDFRLPWSQLLDLGDEDGEGDGDVALLFSDAKVLPDEDRRSFQVELELQAQALVRRPVEAAVLEDLYSTDHELEPTWADRPAVRLLGQGEEQEAARAMLDAGDTEEVLDAELRLGRLVRSQEGTDTVFTQEAEAVVLCRSVDGPVCLRRPVTVTHRLSGQLAGDCCCRTELLRDAMAASSGVGVELTAPVGFRWAALHEDAERVVESAALGEERTVPEDAPSVVLRAVRPGQTLWELAKEAATTPGALMERNGLTTEELTPGQLLMIAK